MSEKGTGILHRCDPAKLFTICVINLFFRLSFPLSIANSTQMFSAPGLSHFTLTLSVSAYFVTSILREACWTNRGFSMYVLHCVSLTISAVAYFSRFSKSWWLDVIFSSRRAGFTPSVAMWHLGLTQLPWVGSFLSTFFYPLRMLLQLYFTLSCDCLRNKKPHPKDRNTRSETNSCHLNPITQDWVLNCKFITRNNLNSSEDDSKS